MANLQFSFTTDWGPLEGTEVESFFHQDNLFIVVEGLGGDYGGKIARDLACRLISTSFFKYMAEVPAPAEAMTKALMDANQTITEEARKLDSKMAAAVSVVYIQNHIMYFSHLGDSRVYSIHGTKINQLTRDHTLGEEVSMVHSEPHDSRMMKALTQGLGITDQPTIEVKKYPLERRDLIILTTDGFTSRISNKEILRHSQKYRNIENMSRNILALARKKGARGDMTLGIIRYGVFSRTTKSIIAAYTSFALVIVLVFVWYLAQFGEDKAGTETGGTVRTEQPLSNHPDRLKQQTASEITKPIASQPVAEEEKVKPAVEVDSIHAFLGSWKSAWENTAGEARDMDRYIFFYSRGFVSRGMNRETWARDKGRKGSRKKWIRVELDRIKIAERSKDHTVRVGFLQKYSSSNYSSTSNKILILRREKSRWKIYREISD